MINFLFRKDINWNLLIITISILALFMHGKVPYMLVLSVSLFLFLIINIFYTNRNNLKVILTNFIDYSKKSIIYLGLVIIYLLEILINKNGELLLYKELIYALYIWVIIGVLFILFKLKPNSELLFKDYFQTGYVYLFLIVILGIISSIINKGILFREIFGLNVDYNFLAFSLLTCFIIIVIKYNNIKRNWKVFLFVVYLMLLAISILLSGSRRGLVFFGFMHIILFVFLLRSILQKTKHKILFWYFLLLTFLIIAISILFYSTTATIRNYIVDKNFPFKREQIKSQYSQILYRYSSIKGDTTSYIERYNKDWISTTNENNFWFNKLMFNKIQKRFKKEYLNKFYDRAFKSLIELRTFSSSIDLFVGILPKEYKTYLTKDFILSDSLLFAPYLYPLPYINRNFYSINKLENVYPLTPLKKDIQLPISYVKGNRDAASLSFFVPILPNSNNNISIYLKGFNKDNLRIFLNIENKPIKIDQLDIGKKQDNGYSLISVKFKIADNKKGVGKLIIQPDLSLNDTLYLGEHWYERVPIDLKDKNKNSIETVRKLQRINSEKIKRHNNYYQRYFNQFKVLSKEQKDSLTFFRNNIHMFYPDFKRYGRYSTVVDENSFQAPGNNIYARCYAVVPCIPGIIYKVNLVVKSEIIPDINIKRYPERTMFNLRKNIIGKEINSLGNNTYSILYDYKITESQSAIGALVVGIRNANKNDSFSISEFKLSIQKSDSIVNITPHQYSYIKSYVFNNFYAMGVDNLKYSKWKNKDFDKNDEMINSRLILWKFAFNYFNDFTLKEKLFGRGFEYLKVYDDVFKTGNDTLTTRYYPHNPIISSLLYSGIFGALIYILFLIQVFYRYIKLRKKIALFGILYFLAFAFTFFSGNSHFSVPAFLILSLIPYAFNIKEIANAPTKN